MRKIELSLGERSYTIFIGQDSLKGVGGGLVGTRHAVRASTGVPLQGRVLVVTNPTVGALYGETVLKSLQKADLTTNYFEVPDGEEHKNLNWASKLYDVMLDHDLDRDAIILALGGGVIGDLSGYVAATFMRGVSFIQAPTTLEAQVDASVGGKVAVNLPRGKNLVGAFYQPKGVFIDPGTLRTLPQREMRAGLAEVIKYAVIGDEEFFEYLSKGMESILNLDMEKLEHIIYTSCQMKAEVVEEDEREGGLRMILNYGHTIAHALEVVAGYSSLRHGEAVAIGMALNARIANRMGRLDEKSLGDIEILIRSAGLPTNVPDDLDTSKIIEAMGRDKKVRSGKIRFVLPDRIGHVFITNEVGEEMIRDVLEGR